MKPITLGSRWKYVGNGPGKGEIHTVVAFNQTEDWIITLGANSSGTINHSWMGEPGYFWLEFTPMN